MGFEGQLSDADRACIHERDGEQPERDRVTLYQLTFHYPRWNYLDGAGGCVARFQRFDEATKRWVTIDTGVGNGELSAARDLRHGRWQRRSDAKAAVQYAKLRGAR
jgi:nitrogen fixation protein FixH